MKEIGNYIEKNLNPNSWIFMILLLPLSLLSFWRVLFFDILQDDNYFLWNAFYHPFTNVVNFRHPGTPIETIFLAPFFGLHIVLWELLGIVLKVIVAYLSGIFLYKLTDSKLAGFLTGIFFSTSYAGMYAINYYGATVTMFTSILLLSSLLYLLKALKGNRKNYYYFCVFLIFSILPDPARALPIIFLLPFLPFLFPKSKKIVRFKKFLTYFLTAFFIFGVPLLMIWFVAFSIGKGTQLDIFLKGMQTNPRYMITKTKDIGNFFATMTNLFTEIVYGLQANPPTYATAKNTIIFEITGIGIFFMGIISFVYFLRSKSRFFAIFSFFIFWIYFFYLPNWVAEPRAAMDSQNYYLFISSIGYICLISYIFSFIKKKWLLFFLSACFVFLNIFKTNTQLSLQYPYRSSSYIELAWNIISKSVPKNEVNDIFLFSGNEYLLDNSIFQWGGYHYLLLRKNANESQIPQLTFDETLVLDRLCGPTKRTTYYNTVISYKQVSPSHVFAWETNSTKTLVDKTLAERKKLILEAQKQNCNLLN